MKKKLATKISKMAATGRGLVGRLALVTGKFMFFGYFHDGVIYYNYQNLSVILFSRARHGYNWYLFSCKDGGVVL